MTEERSDLHCLVSIAVRDANSDSVEGVERCLDILRFLKSLNLSDKDISRVSREEILPLESLRHHSNPKIRTGAKVLLSSWMKTVSSTDEGRRRRNPSSTCNNKARVVKVPSVLKKKKVERSRAHDQVCETKQNLKKTDDRKPFAAAKKQSALSTNPRSLAHEARQSKQNLNKPDVRCKSVPETSRPLQMKKKVSEKNATEMLELFEIAKKSADVANAKGLLLATKETSICVDTLSLLIEFPISSAAPETSRIMDKLAYLTRHKDRKICNSASALLDHWSQSIRDQQTQSC
ncbi:unnamed protein product [Microthlaspi erraticum]|uniref:TFIIS N-terminal domain-containing protein n=1 Tax=Microthlaspi erraticum TaxID=1685480 RepID=A0A6D2KGV8_9BRAS|nr:unnamed protein product [Microthlaspi erraticum]CAA7057763.1 unnamed protein product [Microthlaspi erraticum]